MDKKAEKLVLDYQNDKQSIRLGAETKEDQVDEERIRMLKANELLEQDFLKLQEANSLEFEAMEMDEKEKDILWRKNNQLRRVRKKGFTVNELERIQERIKKVRYKVNIIKVVTLKSFDELDEVANQQKIQAELKNVKESTHLLNEKYDVLPDIASKLNADEKDDTLDNAKYKLVVKNAILSAKNEIRNDELMLQQKIFQQEEITTVKEMQILESKIEMAMAFMSSQKPFSYVYIKPSKKRKFLTRSG